MKNSGVKVFVLGVLLVALMFEINSPWSYGFSIIQGGGIKENLKIVVMQHFLGDNMKIDVFFNPLGYMLMFAGVSMLHREGKFLHNVKVFSGFAAFCNIGKMALPYLMSANKAFTPVILCMILEIVAFLICLYSFMLACKKQVDNYMYMELGKDLTFAVEMYGFSIAFSYFVQILILCQFFFAKPIYVVLYVFSNVAIVYYVWKVLSYTKKLELFAVKE